MRIIGGHDYYDSALAFGRDTDIVFVREPRVIDWTKCPYHLYYDWVASPAKHEDYIEGVGYLGIVSVIIAGKQYTGVSAGDNLVFWDYDKLCEFLVGHGLGPYVPYYQLVTLKDWMSHEGSPPTKNQLEWVIENRVVTAVHAERKYRYGKQDRDWHINDAHDYPLKKFHFQKVIDPYTLNQELAMFVGGVLPRNPNPMVTIKDDKIKAGKHGFDKWSFRRHKDDVK